MSCHLGSRDISDAVGVSLGETHEPRCRSPVRCVAAATGRQFPGAGAGARADFVQHFSKAIDPALPDLPIVLQSAQQAEGVESFSPPPAWFPRPSAPQATRQKSARRVTSQSGLMRELARVEGSTRTIVRAGTRCERRERERRRPCVRTSA